MKHQNSRESRVKFATTQWSLVAAAGETASPESRAALEDLCGRYWYPLYAWLRRQGDPPEAAQDYVQGCLMELIAAGRLQTADPDRGRFRTFLLACLKNHRANSLRAAGAEKRGGQIRLLSLDFERAEANWSQEPQVTATPDLLFDRKWALLLLKQCSEKLQREATERGKSDLFLAVEPHLAGYDHEQSYQAIATQLGLKVTAVKVTVHRWRNRLKELIRQEIRQTVADDAEVDEELDHLLRALTI